MGSALEDFDAIQFTILNWFMWATALLVTILRLIVRYNNLQRLFWDDAFAVSGMVWLTMMTILNHLSCDAIYLIQTIAEGGTPPAPFTTSNKISSTIMLQRKMQMIFMFFFWNCLWSVKGSLLMLYRRLFTCVDGYMKWWWVVVASCVLTWLISVLTNFMTCMPLRRRFSLDPKDSCPISSGISSIWVATSVDITTDIMLGVLPIRLLIGLRIPFKQKLGIGAIFSLGIVIICFSIIRLVKIVQALATNNSDGNISVALWSILETSVAVIVGSLPTLKSLITRRGDTGYSHKPKQITRITRIGTKSSHTAKGTHIRLHGVQPSGDRNTVCTRDDSHEKLAKQDETANICRVESQEQSTSSQDAGRDSSFESFHYATLTENFP